MFVILVAAVYPVFIFYVDILIVIVVVFINVICKATANEKHWIDGNYDDIP